MYDILLDQEWSEHLNTNHNLYGDKKLKLEPSSKFLNLFCDSNSESFSRDSYFKKYLTGIQKRRNIILLLKTY